MKILILYSCSGYPVSSTFTEHLYSFRKYSNHRIYYLNFFFRQPYKLLKLIKYDLVIFHQSFTAPWESSESYRNKITITKSVLDMNVRKVAFFQDEYFQTNLLNELINDLHINVVFSVVPKSERKKIYNKINKAVRFKSCLTGYISNDIQGLIQKLGTRKRNIDIGYRTVWDKGYNLGDFGLNKVKIANLFKNVAEKQLCLDISTDRSDLILGKKWFEFLLTCKYVLGVESGSSLLDRDGSIQDKINAYLSKHPNAGYDEIKASCFNNDDGNLELKAISPRIFEACTTKTCQILLEGKYNHILKPWKHYIPLKKDYSNIRQIINIVKDDNLRRKITSQVYKDIVLSGKYTYSSFIKDFFSAIDENKIKTSKTYLTEVLFYYVFLFNDALSWIRSIYRSTIRNKMSLIK